MFVADLLEDTRSVVAIFPGRFHPFHKGHAYMYQQLVSRYGRDRSFIATSNKVELPKSPFSFSDKAQMMRVAGIPADKIVETRNPYQAQEIVGNFDSASTVLIFAVSQKDMDEDPRFSFKPKKDGSPSYFQPLPDDLKHAKTLDQHGYITTLPTLDFTVLGEPMRSATELRAKYAAADDDTRKAIIKDLYGTYSEEIKNIMDNKIGDNVSTEVTEAFNNPYKLDHDDTPDPYYDQTMSVQLPDKTYLTITFNNEGNNQWVVEFYRDHTQELTGQGDAQRIFATVIDAIQKFIKKEKPASIDFDADKMVEPGQNPESRARLYNSLVKRYASALGYDYNIKDEGDKVYYTLKRSEGVNEDWRKSLTAAAVALGVSGAPATADAGILDAIAKLGRVYGNISNITTKGVEAEINQELKNQMRNDPSSRNLRLQNRNKRAAPTQNRWSDNATIKGSNESVREDWAEDDDDWYNEESLSKRVYQNISRKVFSKAYPDAKVSIEGDQYDPDFDITTTDGEFSLMLSTFKQGRSINIYVERAYAGKYKGVTGQIIGLLFGSAKKKWGNPPGGMYLVPDDDRSDGYWPKLANRLGVKYKPNKVSGQRVHEGVGRIVKGVNTTPDVGVNQVSIEAAKFGNKVDKDGRPPTLSTKVKGKSTNVAFNLGLTESLYKLNRDDPMNSEVLISGMGRYNIKTLHKNLAEKLKDLSERMASMDPDQAQQARHLLTKSPLIPMMDALQQAYDDLKEIKRKGGANSRGIDL